MRKVTGDIWGYLGHAKVVVTTNIGWEPAYGVGEGVWGGSKRELRWVNNMGAGLVEQAARRWPDLPAWYAQTLRALVRPAMWGEDEAVTGSEFWVPPVEHPRLPLIFLPVKPVHPENGPRWSWHQEADLALIEHGLECLTKHEGEIALTLPGCGNGKLKPKQVLPLLEKHLTDDRFVLVDRQLATPLEDALAPLGAFQRALKQFVGRE